MAKRTFLDFEAPVAELEGKIEELRYVQNESAVDISAEIDQLTVRLVADHAVADRNRSVDPDRIRSGNQCGLDLGRTFKADDRCRRLVRPAPCPQEGEQNDGKGY